jgi:hypothetical protein
MRKILLLLLPVTLVLSSCDLFNNFGKKVKVNDKMVVYYKGDGVTETDAKKLGEFIDKNVRGENKDELTAQIMKEGDAYVVRIPVKEEVISKDKERFERIFWFMQDQISENVFEGKKTKVILTDNKLKDKITLDDIAKIEVGKGHYVYLKGNSVKEKDAKEIGEKFEKEQLFPYTQGAILVTKEKGSLVIRFLPNEEQLKSNKESYFSTLANLQYLVGKYVLDQDVKLVVIDEELADVKEFDELSADKKALLDQRMTGQQTTDNTTDPYSQTQYQDQGQTDTDQTPVDNDDDQ